MDNVKEWMSLPVSELLIEADLCRIVPHVLPSDPIDQVTSELNGAVGQNEAIIK